MHMKHVSTRGLEACPPGKFEKLAMPCKIESVSIFSNLSLFSIPVDMKHKASQYVLCMPVNAIIYS